MRAVPGPVWGEPLGKGSRRTGRGEATEIEGERVLLVSGTAGAKLEAEGSWCVHGGEGRRGKLALARGGQEELFASGAQRRMESDHAGPCGPLRSFGNLP